MKRLLIGCGVLLLVIIIIGGVVISILVTKRQEIAQATQGAMLDFASALGDSLQRVEVTPSFKVEGMKTQVRLTIKNVGKASCRYKLLEYKLAGQEPKGIAFPIEFDRLEADQTEEIRLTFENVPWNWNEREATVFESEKNWSQTLPPNDALSAYKLAISSSGENFHSGAVSMSPEEFKSAEPILKDHYPKIAERLQFGATASLDGDITTVLAKFTNHGDLSVLGFDTRSAKLGGNGDVAGEIDRSQPKQFAEIKPGESKTIKATFTNAPWDFSKSDSPFLNSVVEYEWRSPESITFKGNTFHFERQEKPYDGKVFMGVSVKKPAKASAAPKKTPTENHRSIVAENAAGS